MRIGTNLTSVLLAIAATAMLADPSHPQSETLCDQPLAADLAAMYDRIKQLPGASTPPSRNLDFDVVSLQGQVWNFTKASHPAHPSVACRRVVKIGGEFRVQTQLHCNATKEQCDRLAADYVALDKQMMDALKQQAPK
jgi:hypothetical protein